MYGLPSNTHIAILLTCLSRENASVALNEYLEGIGGRENLFMKGGVKGKKRGRPSSGTPSTTTKRSKKNGDADSDAPLPVRNAPWKPPAGSWEDHIAQLDACEDEESGKLMVYLTWKNGHKTQHETAVIYQRCPQKVCLWSFVLAHETNRMFQMLQFYERHVRIIKREDPDVESVSSAKLSNI
jgi:chromobox protein 1